MLPPTGIKRLCEIAEVWIKENPEAPIELRTAFAVALVQLALTEWPESKEDEKILQRFTSAVRAIQCGKNGSTP